MSDATGSGFRSSVRFVLDGDVVELNNFDPNRTVLQFLREDLRRTGTKEGCAEGDCGACTVVVADVDASGMRIGARAINSCIQLLPTLDGKELLTVESLANGGSLHPAQRAMIDCHGSQCGFCTPGFVMSLFALYKNNPAPSRTEIDDALQGTFVAARDTDQSLPQRRTCIVTRRERATGLRLCPVVNLAEMKQSGSKD